MYQSNLNRRLSLLVLFVFVFGMFGCTTMAPDNFTPSEKVQFTTLKTLKSAKIFRETALKSAATFYKKGLMKDDVKEKIIKAGDDLQLAINTAADALLLYKKTQTAEDMASMEAKVMMYQKVFNQFMELVTPYLIEMADE